MVKKGNDADNFCETYAPTPVFFLFFLINIKAVFYLIFGRVESGANKLRLLSSSSNGFNPRVK